MISIQEVLISEDIIDEFFSCALSECKGACCWEGDFGAPVEKFEIDQITKDYNIIKQYMNEYTIAFLEENKIYKKSEGRNKLEISLLENKACVFMNTSELGIAYCTIEKAFLNGETKFRKPLSCHLYPIRIIDNGRLGLKAVNYDKWNICSAACIKGEKEKVRVYEFVKEALIRKYGNAFYEELDKIVKERKKK